MFLYADAILYCLFVWWFSTGAIMYLDGLPRWTFKYSMAGCTLIALAAFGGLARSAHDPSLQGAYEAFTCGVFIWAWLQMTFFMGFITGPRKTACAPGCGGLRHFWHGIETCLWHEAATSIAATAVLTLTLRGANQIGAWTFLVLWWMHQSAKLNVFLGVRNLNEEFLPDHLAYLKSFLTHKPMNLLFPVSVTVSTLVFGWMVQSVVAPGASAFTRVGNSFVATMMAFAILEHWFMMVPFPAAALWKWSLVSRPSKQPFDVQVVAGFLGAGKTTFLRRLLAQARDDVRTVVLVNNFADIGVDGALLVGQGAHVVELPHGCVCCSLSTDLARQLDDVVVRYAPQRVLIEPSGVADLDALLNVLNGPDLAPLVRSIDVTTVLDAGSFLSDFGRMEAHLAAQISPAGRVVINKADLVSLAVLRTVASTVRSMAPASVIVAARFALVDESAVLIGSPPPRAAEALPALKGNVLELHPHHAPAGDARGFMQSRIDQDHGGPAQGAAKRDAASGHTGTHGVLGLTSWSSMLPANCNPDGLYHLLEAVAAGEFGHVERVKGVARAGTGWVRFDVAGQRANMAAFAAGTDETARVVAIGRQVDEERLAAAFEACAIADAAA